MQSLSLVEQSRHETGAYPLTLKIRQHCDVFQFPLWSIVLRYQEAYSLLIFLMRHPGKARRSLCAEDVGPLLRSPVCG